MLSVKQFVCVPIGKFYTWLILFPQPAVLTNIKCDKKKNTPSLAKLQSQSITSAKCHNKLNQHKKSPDILNRLVNQFSTENRQIDVIGPSLTEKLQSINFCQRCVRRSLTHGIFLGQSAIHHEHVFSVFLFKSNSKLKSKETSQQAIHISTRYFYTLQVKPTQVLAKVSNPPSF